MHDKTIQTLAKAGLLAAAIFLLTAVVSIPIPGGLGYVNLGDAGVLTAAALLGGWWGAACAGVSAALADLSCWAETLDGDIIQVVEATVELPRRTDR